MFIVVILVAGTAYTLARYGNAPLLTPAYLIQQLQIGSFLGIIAAGMMLVILISQIDLSVPWTLAAGAMTATAVGGEWALPAALGVGLFVGLLNGFGVAYYFYAGRQRRYAWSDGGTNGRLRTAKGSNRSDALYCRRANIWNSSRHFRLARHLDCNGGLAEENYLRAIDLCHRQQGSRGLSFRRCNPTSNDFSFCHLFGHG
jgi:hypothetical protein